MQKTITKKSDTEIEIAGSLEPHEIEAHRNAALKSLGKDLALPGFRKGHVPLHIVAERLGKGEVWARMAERALADAYPKIILEEKLRAVGRPRVTVTKLAPGNRLEFRIETSILPETALPDYKAIAGRVPEEAVPDVTEHELEDALERLKEQPGKREGANADMPPDAKAHLKEHMQKEKELRAREKRRIAILDAILKETRISLPEIIIESELSKMLAQFRADVEHVGLALDDYLKQIKKTENDLRNEWRPDAEKRARTQLLLNEIAQAEKIAPDEKAVAHEVERVLKHHKDADPSTGLGVNKIAARIYVETILTNEAVLAFLENQKVTI